MPVFLKHRGVWLRVKEVYRIEPRRSKKRGKKRSSSGGSYGMLVAESLEKLPLDGLRYKAEIPISSTRVTRFAAQVALTAPHVTVVIEPRGDDYVAIVYAKNKKELEQNVRLIENIARQVGVAMEEEEEEAEEMEEEEGEEE